MKKNREVLGQRQLPEYLSLRVIGDYYTAEVGSTSVIIGACDCDFCVKSCFNPERDNFYIVKVFAKRRYRC